MEQKLPAAQPTSTQETSSKQGVKKVKKKYHASAMYAAQLCRSAITHVKPNSGGGGLNL